jgi:hypothetical protein
MVGARFRVALSPLCCGPRHGRASVMPGVSQGKYNASPTDLAVLVLEEW